MEKTYELQREKEFSITSYNADFEGKATLPSFMQFLQEIAWEHAEHLDLGFSHLTEQNVLWVLARLKIKVNEFPNWQNVVKVKTWAAGKDNLFWYRDFKIFDSNGNVLAKATTSWIIINIETRRPQRADKMFRVAIDVDERVFDEKLGKLPPLNCTDIKYQKVVGYSDLDLNDHVNNVKYIEWILDSYPLNFFKENKIDTVEVNYLAEAMYGDKILVNSACEGLTHLHSVKRETDKKELLKAKIDWVKRS
ncbi:MAG: thioesterase [Ignavibacteria bacterium]|jgi:acyl-ACP thioesterase